MPNVCRQSAHEQPRKITTNGRRLREDRRGAALPGREYADDDARRRRRRDLPPACPRLRQPPRPPARACGSKSDKRRNCRCPRDIAGSVGNVRTRRVFVRRAVRAIRRCRVRQPAPVATSAVVGGMVVEQRGRRDYQHVAGGYRYRKPAILSRYAWAIRPECLNTPNLTHLGGTGQVWTFLVRGRSVFQIAWHGHLVRGRKTRARCPCHAGCCYPT